jgi:hypothetical protein
MVQGIRNGSVTKNELILLTTEIKFRLLPKPFKRKKEIMSNTYWPEQLAAGDFQG